MYQRSSEAIKEFKNVTNFFFFFFSGFDGHGVTA